MRYFLSIILTSSFLICNSQNEAKIDSVNQLLNNAASTEDKLELHKEAIYLKTSTDLEGMLENVEELKSLQTNENCASCLGVALHWEGVYYYLKGDRLKGIPLFENSVKESFAAKDYYTGNRSNTLLSGIYFSLNNYEKAQLYAQNLIDFGKTQEQITDAYIDGYFMMGLINDDQSYYSLAINNYNISDSLNTLKKGSNYYSYQAKLYNNLSIVFIQIKDFEKANFYLKKTKENYLRDNNVEGLNSVKQNFGYLKVEEEEFTDAIPILLETKKYYDDLGMEHNSAQAEYLLGKAYFGTKEYNIALSYLKNAVLGFKKSGDTLNAGLGHKYLGDSYLNTSDFYNSEKNLLEASSIFKKFDALRNQVNTLKSLATLNEKKGDLAGALKRRKELDSVSDVFRLKQNEIQVFELDTKYQTKKKEQEIALLTSQNKLAVQQKKNQRNLLLGGLGLTTAAGVFLFLGYRNRKKTNDKLRELDQIKSNFFANISHEFRTPLSLIAGPIEQQLQKEDITAQERQNLQIAQRNSTRLVTLVDQLLDLSKLESGHFSLKVQQGNLDSFLKSLTGSFDFIAQENEHTYTKQISVEGTNHWFDTDALEKIITNLISNAIKYSPSGESISVIATAQNQELQLTIKNSGAQLPHEILSTLFNRFQRADETTAGTGIGLALTKELVTLHKGAITVKSDTDWTTFMVVLPLSESVFTTSEKAEGVSSEYAFAKSNLRDSRPSGERSSKAKQQPTLEHPLVDEVDIFSKDEKPILLIVDDNEDLRSYVSSLFNESHTIHTAVNGKEGFEKALSEVPDLIITDLMMPEDDGIMLTQNCKTTEATSHIPVLMLTAKAGDENKLIGLETGADAYLTKPFNTEILKTTVHNLQETRDKLQERFSQEVVLLPKDIATNSTDERFLTNLQEVMDKSLIESDFNTEAFAEAVGMSRMQLHRKLKALTGLSATEFIRGQRLKLAAQMLKKSDINVSQVGYAVGFNNHSYFTKCFKEKYGISPSEYSKKS